MGVDLSQALSRAAKALTQLERAGQFWDFKSFEENKLVLTEEMSHLLGWKEKLSQIEEHLRSKENLLKSDTYRRELENALFKANISFEAAFPVYRIPPFEMRLVPEEKTVVLRLGRRTQKTGLFEPQALAEWIKKCHNALVKRPFKAHRFFSDLLSAYRVANRLIYSKDRGVDVLWGRAVALRQIYELLTLRTEARLDYRKENFVYDLARLRAEGLNYDEYSLEFGYTKDQKGSFLVPDLASGREERFSTLTIYRNRGEK